MSARRKSGQSTTTTPEATAVEKSPDVLNRIFDDFINAQALVTVACRLIDEWDDEDRGAAVLVLGQGVKALSGISDRLEKARMSQERVRGQGGRS